jgi:hypothetical protein
MTKYYVLYPEYQSGFPYSLWKIIDGLKWYHYCPTLKKWSLVFDEDDKITYSMDKMGYREINSEEAFIHLIVDSR